MNESPADLKSKEVSWNRPKLDRFKLIITKADEAKAETVMFDGNEYDVAYGLYLIEYLEYNFRDEH